MESRISGWQWALLVVAFAFLLTGILTSFPLWPSIMLVAFGTICLGFFVYWRSRPPSSIRSENLNPGGIKSLSARSHSIMEKSQSLKIREKDLEIFYALLVRPSDFRARVREQVDLTIEPVRQRTTVSLRIPDDGHDPFLLPLFRPVKRQMIRNIQIADKDDNPIDSLNRDETLAHLVRLARHLLEKALNLDPARDLPERAGMVYAFVVETMIELPDKNELRTTESRNQRRESVGNEFDSLAKTVQVKDDASLKQLRTLTLVCACYYVIAAWVPSDIQVFSYSFDLSRLGHTLSRPATSRRERFRNKVMNFLKALALSTPASVRISVNKGNSCDSYHLSIAIPENGYIASTCLVDTDGNPVPRPSGVNYDYGPGYFRLTGRSTSQAHLYARGLSDALNLSKTKKYPMALAITVYERPPGSLGRAVILSGLVLVALYLSAVRFQRDYELNIDAFAAIGAVIAVVIAIWGAVVGGGSSGRPRIAAALAQLSLIATVACVISGAALLTVANEGVVAANAPFGVRFFEVQAFGWVVTCSIAFVTFVAGVATIAVRLLRITNLAAHEVQRNLDLSIISES